MTKSLQFGKNSIGLTDVLSNLELVSDVINIVNQQLHVITIGSRNDENQFILKFQNFKKIIDFYRNSYDFIVIVSEEKRDSFFSEIMYQCTDQVILVTPKNVERKCDLQSFQSIIAEQHSELMGVVFND